METVYRQGSRVRRSLAAAISLDVGGVVALVLVLVNVGSTIVAICGVLVTLLLWMAFTIWARPQSNTAKENPCGEACASCADSQSCAVRLDAEVTARIAEWDLGQLRRIGERSRYSFLLPLALACATLAVGPARHHGWGSVLVVLLFVGATISSLVTVVLARSAST